MSGITKGCSAYCNPAIGVHAIIDYSREEPVFVRARVVGMLWTFRNPNEKTHLPTGTQAVVLSVDEAVEAPPSPDTEYPYAILMRIAVKP